MIANRTIHSLLGSLFVEIKHFHNKLKRLERDENIE